MAKVYISKSERLLLQFFIKESESLQSRFLWSEAKPGNVQENWLTAVTK